VFRTYQPPWAELPPAVVHQVLAGNYERIFDEARRRVRAWDRMHPRDQIGHQPIVHRATGPD
jgi:hypothetical protein